MASRSIQHHAPRSAPAATPGGFATILGALASALTLVPSAFAAGPAATEAVFRDAAVEAGVTFRHFNGMVGSFYFPEMTGQGGALFDFDGDGDLDVYFRQGTMLGKTDRPDQALFPITESLGDRLYRNDSTAENGSVDHRFVDVSTRAGLEATGYGMGMAVGDYDGDGHLDIYLTNYDDNQMWRNRGDGSFENVTAKTGTAESRWSTSSTFVDVDGDGDLDLFAANYVLFDVDRNPRCFASTSARDYCGPSAFASEPDRLWRNRGDGTFEDVSVESGIARVRGAGLGVISGDFNGDGKTDLYVANDGEANHLWLNRGNGVFADDALFSGTAFNRHGSPEASMGLAAADFDGDGREDLFLTHLAQESNTFYRSLGDGLFEDRSRETRLAAPSMPYTSFGVSPVDFDNDGWPDLAVANGAVRVLLDLAASGDPYPLAQPNQLFRNRGDGSFEEVTGRAGPGFTDAEVSRGLASGDLDQDGGVDLVLFNNNGPARLLINQAARGSNWLGIAGVSTGSRLSVTTSGGRSLSRGVRTDGSYCSASDARAIVGLGSERPSELHLRHGARPIRIHDPPVGVYLVIDR